MFGLTGIDDDGVARSVSWHEPGVERRVSRTEGTRGLGGDPVLIATAIADETLGREYRATATGPFLTSDLDDPVVTFRQLASYFRRVDQIDGRPPRVSYAAPAEADGQA